MSVISGIIGASAASDAASTQAAASETASDAALTAARESIAAQKDMFEKGRLDTAPWREAGEKALNTLVTRINAGPGDYTKSPGYKFRLGEGTKAIERSAAARGGLLSGATGKALTRFGQDYATGDYQNFLANYYNSLTPLQSLAGVGQTTASQNAVQGNQLGTNIGNTTMAGVNASNNALLNGANATAGGYINTANAITGASNTGVNNYLMWKYLNKGATPAAAADYSYLDTLGEVEYAL